MVDERGSALNIWVLIPSLREAQGVIRDWRMRQITPVCFVHESAGHRLFVQICGMGEENARRCAESVPVEEKDLLVLVGFCGGLDEAPRVGDLVIDTQWPDRQFVDAIMVLAAKRGIACHIGMIHTSSSVLMTPAEKRSVGTLSKAIAVDMEGAAVLGVCRTRNVLFRSFRAVSDVAAQRLPSALRYIRLDGTRKWLFWWVLACFVWEWPCVFRAIQSARQAEQNLACILSDWVQEMFAGGWDSFTAS